MLCVIAKLDDASTARLSLVMRAAEEFGAPPKRLYGHITLAVYLDERANEFIEHCKAALKRVKPFLVRYERVEALTETNIIVASPENGGELARVKRELTGGWEDRLDYWTGTDAWRPHTTLAYWPRPDILSVARALNARFDEFTARVERIDITVPSGGGYELIESIELE